MAPQLSSATTTPHPADRPASRPAHSSPPEPTEPTTRGTHPGSTDGGRAVFGSTVVPGGDDFVSEWYRWHGRREAALVAPYGWLSLTGIHWFTLAPDLTVPDFPGSFRRHDDQVVYTPDTASTVAADGRSVSGPIPVLPYESGTPTTLQAGDIRAELILRGGTFAVRTRDPRSELRAAFRGVPHFAVDPGWDVPANFESFESPTELRVGAAAAGVSHHKSVIGRLHLELDGEPQSLLVFETNGTGPSILFKDPTNTDTTYGAGRFIYLHTNDPAALTHLDLNRAVNPPCAFSPHCTCPLPPPENTLTVPVTAGETLPTSFAIHH